MSFITPMFAAAMPKVPLDLRSGEWYAELKIDGHRLILEKSAHGVMAWSRNGLMRPLPFHIVEAARKLPDGIYDGELHVPGGRSYGVTEIENGPDLVYTVFDILQSTHGEVFTDFPYTFRRNHLRGILSKDGPICRGWSVPVPDQPTLINLLEEIWARDGEGLILKHQDSLYLSGKRPKNTWIKIKQLQSTVLAVAGFIPSKGKINDRGKYATVVLVDEEGNYTTVKTRNDEACREFEREAIPGPLVWGKMRFSDGTKLEYHWGVSVNSEFALGDPPAEPHPAIGRKLRVEFQERTPDRNYRHPRWDRWEDE